MQCGQALPPKTEALGEAPSRPCCYSTRSVCRSCYESAGRSTTCRVTPQLATGVEHATRHIASSRSATNRHPQPNCCTRYFGNRLFLECRFSRFFFPLSDVPDSPTFFGQNTVPAGAHKENVPGMISTIKTRPNLDLEGRAQTRLPFYGHYDVVSGWDIVSSHLLGPFAHSHFFLALDFPRGPSAFPPGLRLLPFPFLRSSACSSARKLRDARCLCDIQDDPGLDSSAHSPNLGFQRMQVSSVPCAVVLAQSLQ